MCENEEVDDENEVRDERSDKTLMKNKDSL